MNAVEERELREALAPNRPDPEAFRRAVLARLEERGRGAEQRRPALSTGWRAAAGVLPLGLLDPAGSALPATAATKKLGLALGALFTLPAVSIAMLALAFATALKRLSGLRGGANGSPDAADEAQAEWLRANRWRFLATLVGIVALALWLPAEALVAILLASMAYVTAVVLGLARAGAATRASVGRLCAGFLGALLVLAMLFDGFAAGLRTQRVPEHWIPFLVLAGCLACDLLSRWCAGWSWRRKAGNLALTLGVCGPLLGWLDARMAPTSEQDAREWVEAFDAELDEPVRWLRLAGVVRSLRGAGAAELDLARARAAVAAAWERVADEAEPFGPGQATPSWGAAAAAGLLPEAAWERLRAEQRVRGLLAPDAPPPAPTWHALGVRALLRGPLDDLERERLAQGLRAAWLRHGERPALAERVELCALLDELGRPLDVPDAAALTERLLRRSWRGTGHARERAAGFAASEPRLEAGRVADVFLVAPTADAVALFARFGAPEEVDLTRVRAFLARAARPSIVEALAPSSLPLLAVQPFRYEAGCALRELDAAFPALAARAHAPGRLLHERVLLGTALLVALCLIATLRAGRAAAPTRPS